MTAADRSVHWALFRFYFSGRLLLSYGFLGLVLTIAATAIASTRPTFEFPWTAFFAPVLIFSGPVGQVRYEQAWVQSELAWPVSQRSVWAVRVAAYAVCGALLSVPTALLIRLAVQFNLVPEVWQQFAWVGVTWAAAVSVIMVVVEQYPWPRWGAAIRLGFMFLAFLGIVGLVLTLSQPELFELSPKGRSVLASALVGLALVGVVLARLKPSSSSSDAQSGRSAQPVFSPTSLLLSLSAVLAVLSALFFILSLETSVLFVVVVGPLFAQWVSPTALPVERSRLFVKRTGILLGPCLGLVLLGQLGSSPLSRQIEVSPTDQDGAVSALQVALPLQRLTLKEPPSVTSPGGTTRVPKAVPIFGTPLRGYNPYEAYEADGDEFFDYQFRRLLTEHAAPGPARRELIRKPTQYSLRFLINHPLTERRASYLSRAVPRIFLAAVFFFLCLSAAFRTRAPPSTRAASILYWGQRLALAGVVWIITLWWLLDVDRGLPSLLLRLLARHFEQHWALDSAAGLVLVGLAGWFCFRRFRQAELTTFKLA